MGKLLNAVRDRYYLAVEAREEPVPDYDSVGTTISDHFNRRRDLEFGLNETAQRIHRQLLKLNSDQLDQLWLKAIPQDKMSEMTLEKFQANASNPTLNGTWLLDNSMGRNTFLKLTEELENMLPEQTIDEVAQDINTFVPMIDDRYPKEEKYDYPVKNEIEQLKNSLPEDQKTEENLRLLDQVNEETRTLSEKYFSYLKTSMQTSTSHPVVKGLQNYAERSMYAYQDEYFKTGPGAKYAKDIAPLKGKSRNNYYDHIFDWHLADSKKTPSLVSKQEEIKQLETGISEKTLQKVTSVLNDIDSFGPNGYDYDGIMSKYQVPLSEYSTKAYALTPIGKARDALEQAVKTGNMDDIRKAHENYVNVKNTMDHMMATAKTNAEEGQTDLFEGNLDAMRNATTPIPAEYLQDVVGHSKLAGMLILKNFANAVGLKPEDILKKPVDAGLKATEFFYDKNGLNKQNSLGAKLSRGLNGELAGSVSIGYSQTVGGAIIRAIESSAGFAHSKEEAQSIVGQAALAGSMGNAMSNDLIDDWKALAAAGMDKHERLFGLALLTPENEFNLQDLATKFNKKNWSKELSVDKLLKESVSNGGFDYEGLLEKGNALKQDFLAENASALATGDESSFQEDKVTEALARNYQKILQAAPENERNTPGYLKLQRETDKMVMTMNKAVTAETEFNKQLNILGKEKTGLFVSKRNSTEHEQMMEANKFLKLKMQMLKGTDKGFSRNLKEELEKVTLADAIRNARNATMKYSRKVEEDGKKTSFRYDSGADRANAASALVEQLDAIADRYGARSELQKLEDDLQRDTMDERKDLQTVTDNAAKSLYSAMIRNNPEKYPPEKQKEELSEGNVNKAIKKIKKDPAFKEMMKTVGRSKMADKIIEGPMEVTGAYLDAMKKLNDQSLGKKGSEMSAEEKKEFWKNASFEQPENEQPQVPMFK